jgi:hypothetical protein
MHVTYGRKLAESVIGLLFATAVGAVKLHTDLPDTKNPQVRVHYQEKLYEVMTCGNVDPKFVGKFLQAKKSRCFRSRHALADQGVLTRLDRRRSPALGEGRGGVVVNDTDHESDLGAQSVTAIRWVLGMRSAGARHLPPRPALQLKKEESGHDRPARAPSRNEC